MFQGGIIDEAFKSFFDNLSARLGDSFYWLSDPFFWYWLPRGVLAILVLAFIGWGFQSLRAPAAAFILAIIAALGFYRKGEMQERDRHAAKKRDD